MFGINHLLETLFPAYCLSCGARTEFGRKFLCEKCISELPLELEWSGFYEAQERLQGIVPFTEFRSDLIFSRYGPARLLLHQIKYHGHPELARLLAEKFGREHRDKGHFRDVSLIIPIPLSPERLRERGYNQSAYIAKGLSQALGIPVESGVLCRKSKEGTQTTRGKGRRWTALEELFYLKDPERIKGRRLLVVDDLLTSGSTLLHAGRALLSAPEPPESLSFYTLFLNHLH